MTTVADLSPLARHAAALRDALRLGLALLDADVRISGAITIAQTRKTLEELSPTALKFAAHQVLYRLPVEARTMRARVALSDALALASAPEEER